MDRMITESDYYIEWEDVLDFFTRRGRPLHIQEKIEKQQKIKEHKEQTFKIKLEQKPEY